MFIASFARSTCEAGRFEAALKEALSMVGIGQIKFIMTFTYKALTVLL